MFGFCVVDVMLWVVRCEFVDFVDFGRFGCLGVDFRGGLGLVVVMLVIMMAGLILVFCWFVILVLGLGWVMVRGVLGSIWWIVGFRTFVGVFWICRVLVLCVSCLSVGNSILCFIGFVVLVILWFGVNVVFGWCDVEFWVFWFGLVSHLGWLYWQLVGFGFWVVYSCSGWN